MEEHKLAEIRKDIITGASVIISPERAKRPEDFKSDHACRPSEHLYEKNCPFCRGNESMTPPELLAYSDDQNRETNTAGWIIRSVPNLFAPVKADVKFEVLQKDFYEKTTAAGTSEVFVETPEHNVTLGAQTYEHVETILRGLKERYISLKSDDRLEYIQIFKNFGGAAGASKEHGHWQIWAVPIIPDAIRSEIDGSREYFQHKDSCPYCDIIIKELNEKERLVAETEEMVALCPFASFFAYETWIMPKKHNSRFENISDNEIKEMAALLKDIISKIEKKFDYPPYNIIFRTMPMKMGDEIYYHWHLEVLPKLFIVAGFELGTGMIVNPTPPEIAAQVLREN